jgi:CRP-like cAMP-binding protein
MIKVLQDTHLDVPTLTSLSKYISDRRYRVNTHILVEDREAEAALYLIRQGKVHLYTKDGSRNEIIGAGGYFGEGKIISASSVVLVDLLFSFRCYRPTSCGRGSRLQWALRPYDNPATI